MNGTSEDASPIPLTLSSDSHAHIKSTTTEGAVRNIHAREKRRNVFRGHDIQPGIFALPFPTNVEALANEARLDNPAEFDANLLFTTYEDIARHGGLKVALPIVTRSTDAPRLFHPTTSSGLLRKIIQITSFKPLPNFSRLLKFHDGYPHLHSTKTFNYLIQFAIRHTDYTTAATLLQRVLQSGLRFDTETRILHVRLLIRTDKMASALKMIQRDISNGLEVPPELWIELLGYAEPSRSGNGGVNDDNTSKSNGNLVKLHLPEDRSMEWKGRLLASLSRTCLHIEDTRVLDRFVFFAVQLLLRQSDKQAAQSLTKEWLAKLPPRLNKPRSQRSLNILHLHLAHSDMGIKGHLIAREFLKEFLQLCPTIEPNSSTLFLLLRSLKRSCVNGTAIALSLVYSFQEKWSSSTVDRRVRRRIVAIALKEGKLDVARRWLRVEERLTRAQDNEALVRQVAGVQQPRSPENTKKLPMRRFMVGQEAENRKWTWVRRRYARTRGRGVGSAKEEEVDDSGL
ncbi:hypothetical protein SCHPADRAFT_939976 [Schizopora paradoxa]|uniref:Uncharacterized protein n=1 Tax=Schizopora paradoxa TaxID=27342 RepID=A0A0H2RQZ1_9AGAM|nr:hypothetical protein SCHPADRAFT_939976 [Schizopora paradoxa]